MLSTQLKMPDKLYKLQKPEKLDTNGWNIDFQELMSPKRDVHPFTFLSDFLYESPDNEFACLFYTIHEYKMSWYAGLVGIFKNKSSPTLLANPIGQYFDWQGEKSLCFFDNILFLRKLAYHQDENLSGTPFMIFDLEKMVFGFVDFDATSIYYSPIKIGDTLYKFHLDTPSELPNLYANRNDETFDLTHIKFYSFDNLNKLLELYFNQKMKNLF